MNLEVSDAVGAAAVKQAAQLHLEVARVGRAVIGAGQQGTMVVT